MSRDINSIIFHQFLFRFSCSNSNPLSCTNKSNFTGVFYSPFCVQAKIIKLVGLKNGGRLSPINLVTFAGTQNGEYQFSIDFKKNGQKIVIELAVYVFMISKGSVNK